MISEMMYFSEAYEPKAFGYTEAKYEDETGVHKKIITEGEFQHADLQNANGRIYTESLLRRETGKLAAFIEARNGLPMEMDHPIPDPNNKQVSMTQLQRATMMNACALCVHLEMNGKVVYGKAEVLEGDHGAGDKLAAMLRRKFKPAVSSRGVGPEPQRGPNGIYMIPESFSMVTYDFVTNPSTHNAVLTQYMEECLHMYDIKPQRKLWEVLADISDKGVIR